MQLTLSRTRLALAVCLSCTIVGEANAADFSQLAAHVPTGANAVIIVDAVKMFASPLAQGEGWQQKFADAFEVTPFILPPSAKRCVMAARINRQSLQSEWQAAALEVAVDPTLADLAKRRGGEVKQLGAAPAVLLPGKTWVAKFGPSLFGVLTPASEPLAARWAAMTKEGEPGNLPAYLRQAVAAAETAEDQVVLAMDLAGAFKPEAVRAKVTGSAVLKGVDPDQAAKILASVQGVRFGVRITDVLTGRLELEFAEDAAPLGPVAKPLILTLVGKAGAMLDEFPQWTAAVEGRRLTLSGDLTPEGMQRVFSLLQLNSTVVDDPAPYEPATSPATPPAKDAMARASLRYFRAVNKFVESSQRLNRADSLGQALMWLENFARRVQNLPTKNVDPELIDYGHYVAQTMQSIVDQASGIEQKLAQAQDSSNLTNYSIGLLPTARTVNYGGYRTREFVPYGFATFDANAAAQADEQIQKAEEEAYQAVQAARDTLTKLAADHETVRKNLSQRYGLKF